MRFFVWTLFLTTLTATLGEEFGGYVFVHFTAVNGVDRESIYISASVGNNILNWTQLNNGEPIFTSKLGTTGLRDPFIIRSVAGDKFWILATDLLTIKQGGWDDVTRFGSRYLEVWESTDLVNWSKQRHTLVSPPEVGCSWAPEAHYDKESGKYLVYWASTLYEPNDVEHAAGTYHRLLAATTEDFVTFSEPKVWQDSKNMRIDTSVFEEDGVFYRFTVGGINGCHDIFQERSKNLTAPVEEWEVQMSCLSKKINSTYIEGPTVVKANPGDERGQKYYLFVDEIFVRGYVPLETDDIKNPDWKVSEDYKLPGRPRHGTVIPVTATELERVRAALG